MENNFSSGLQRLRKQKGVTQEALASHLGVSPQAVSKWENGSYPDGDLLPKIADFFDVSIDCLYGRDDGNVSTTQKIIDELQQVIYETENGTSGFFDKVLEYAWAIQISAWENNKYFYDRPALSKDNITTVSEVTHDAGFTYMRLNNDLEYYIAVKQPPEGFTKRLAVTDDMVKLFSFMGDKTNLKILQFMLTFYWKESVRAKTVSKLLNIPLEKAEKALEFLCEYKGIIKQSNILNEDGKTEKIYCTSTVKAVAAIMLFISADMMINNPDNYQNQIGWTDNPWFKREDMPFIHKDKEYYY